MICQCAVPRQCYMGHALHYHKSHSFVRMIGPGYFCFSCEVRTRALSQLLANWGIFALDVLEWETLILHGGVLIGPHVLLHSMKRNTLDRMFTFREVYLSLYVI